MVKMLKKEIELECPEEIPDGFLDCNCARKLPWTPTPHPKIQTSSCQGYPHKLVVKM